MTVQCNVSGSDTYQFGAEALKAMLLFPASASIQACVRKGASKPKP